MSGRSWRKNETLRRIVADSYATQESVQSIAVRAGTTVGNVRVVAHRLKLKRPPKNRGTVPKMTNPLEFFMTNVDSWGAREWFQRLQDAVKAHDKAVVAAYKDEDTEAANQIRAETFKNIAMSSAFRLARDHGEEILDLTRRNALMVEALAEIKATVDGGSDQPVKDIIYGLIEELK